jgi:D-sedoheptulose 7-phosphate isomerase
MYQGREHLRRKCRQLRRFGEDTMTDGSEESVVGYFRKSCGTLMRATEDRDLIASITSIVDTVTRAFRAGGKVLIAGNGGSAADAQHIAGEFLSRLNIDRKPLPAVALTSDTSVLTAIGNDYGFDSIFERQVRGLGRPGDVLIAISTSGRSRNIIAALKAAREIGLITVGFTGSGTRAMATLCDLCLSAPSDETPQIQQIHIVAAHAICSLVECELFGQPAASSERAEYVTAKLALSRGPIP